MKKEGVVEVVEGVTLVGPQLSCGPLGIFLSMSMALPSITFLFYFAFFNVNFGPLPKNSGPNPMSFFSFWQGLGWQKLSFAPPSFRTLASHMLPSIQQHAVSKINWTTCLQRSGHQVSQSVSLKSKLHFASRSMFKTLLRCQLSSSSSSSANSLFSVSPIAMFTSSTVSSLYFLNKFTYRLKHYYCTSN